MYFVNYILKWYELQTLSIQWNWRLTIMNIVNKYTCSWQCIDILILVHILLLLCGAWWLSCINNIQHRLYVSYASFICEITLILNIDGHVQTLFICRRVSKIKRTSFEVAWLQNDMHLINERWCWILSANVGKSNQIGMFLGSFELYTNFNIYTHAINAYNKCIIVPMSFCSCFWSVSE